MRQIEKPSRTYAVLVELPDDCAPHQAIDKIKECIAHDNKEPDKRFHRIAVVDSAGALFSNAVQAQNSEDVNMETINHLLEHDEVVVLSAEQWLRLFLASAKFELSPRLSIQRNA